MSLELGIWHTECDDDYDVLDHESNDDDNDDDDDDINADISFNAVVSRCHVVRIG
jgi:hypothetical protein